MYYFKFILCFISKAVLRGFVLYSYDRESKFIRNFLFVNVIVFLQRQNLRFTVEDLVTFSRMRVYVTGQHNWRVKFSAGQVAILARHCPLTSCYFEP